MNYNSEVQGYSGVHGVCELQQYVQNPFHIHSDYKYLFSELKFESNLGRAERRAEPT